jgi:hypothetical protein
MAPSTFDTTDLSSVTKLTTVDDLNKKVDQLRRYRQPLENQWKLNLAFYKGKQYAYFNRATRRLESLPIDDGEKPRYRVRLVSNQIISGSQSLLSKLTKTKPEIYAEPGSGSDADLKAAQMAQSLFEYWWDDLFMDDLLEEALLWAIIAGQGWWRISWDAQAGKEMKFMLDPQGKPITDDSIKDLFRAELGKAGVEPQEKVVYMGDVKIDVCSPFDVYIDPTVRNWPDAQYAICVYHMSPDEVKSRWKVSIQPDSVATAPDNLLPMSNAPDAEKPDAINVYYGYFKPGPIMPKGRLVVWTKGQILEDGAWPYPFNDLPLVKFAGVRVPGQPYDSSVVEHALPLQKELNKTLSQIVEYKNLTVKPRVWAPTGSISTRLTTEPGALYEYNPIGDHKPEIEKLPAMPPYIFEHLSNIKDALKDVFFITDVTEGTVPPNVEAGIAIDLLQEMATDRLAPIIRLMEHSIAASGQLLLMFAQKYYAEPRLMKITGSGGGIQVKRFTQSDIEGSISIRAKTGSGLPRTRAGKQALILSLVEKNVIQPDDALKYIDLGADTAIQQRLRADEDQALREHEKLISGEPVNYVEYAQAIQQAEAGQLTDPDTGQPIQDPNQMHEAIENAGLKPLPFENFEQHMSTHALFMKSADYEALPLEVQEAFQTHYSQTLQYFLKLPKPVEYQAVRPTLQIKSTIGPTGAADILNKAGVYEIDPQIMSEPPLETWVSDDITKAAVQTTGNINTSPQDQMKAAQTANLIEQDQAAHIQKQMAMAEQHQREADLHAMELEKQQHVATQEAYKASAAAAQAHLAHRTAKEKRINTPKPTPKKK